MDSRCSLTWRRAFDNDDMNDFAQRSSKFVVTSHLITCVRAIEAYFQFSAIVSIFSRYCVATAVYLAKTKRLKRPRKKKYIEKEMENKSLGFLFTTRYVCRSDSWMIVLTAFGIKTKNQTKYYYYWTKTEQSNERMKRDGERANSNVVFFFPLLPLFDVLLLSCCNWFACQIAFDWKYINGYSSPVFFRLKLNALKWNVHCLLVRQVYQRMRMGAKWWR